MKENIASMNDLSVKIRELEAAEALQTALLKEQATKVLNGLKPSSIIKNTISGIASSGNLKNEAIDISLGMGVGWLARKIFQANSTNIFRKLTGFVLQNITTGIVTRKMPEIREKITHLKEL